MIVKNEAEMLGKTLPNLSKHVDEIILVDTGSSDETVAVAEKFGAKVYHFAWADDFAAARNESLKHATGDITIIQDADLEYDPQDYNKLILPIIKNEVKAVYGSRHLNRKHKINKYLIATKALTLLTNFLYVANITDEPTCYKVFKTKVLKSINLKCTRFEFCPEVTAKLCKKGYKIKEVPISYTPRTIKEGKKIKYRDGFEAVWTLIKYKFIN